ncbi:MAG: hypothetical protein WKG07_31620 [Hymenobacter sp.]
MRWFRRRRRAGCRPKPLPPARFDPRQRPRHLPDEQLLDQVQRQTFQYFWVLGERNAGHGARAQQLVL